MYTLIIFDSVVNMYSLWQWNNQWATGRISSFLNDMDGSRKERAIQMLAKLNMNIFTGKLS